MIATVEPREISVTNRAINEFFAGKSKNSKGIKWVDPRTIETIPRELREIFVSLEKFFQKKRWYNGGPIPNELLYTKSNFHLVNNISLYEALELAYDSVNRDKFLIRTYYKKNIEIPLTLRVIHECEKKSIPQYHIGGLLLLYFSLCEKVVLL